MNRRPHVPECVRALVAREFTNTNKPITHWLLKSQCMMGFE